MEKNHCLMLVILAGALTTAVGAEQSLATTPASREEQKGWMQRHERFNEQAKKGGFDVLFIGDSITQGWEGAGKQVWQSDIAPLNAANFGIGGDRTEHLLWRFEHGNLEGALSPKAIVLMIGTNNTGHRKDKPEDLAAGVEAILRKLNARFPKAKILLLAIFPRGANAEDGLRKNNDAANNLLAKFDGRWNTRYLDIGAKFLQPDGVLTREIMPDLLHLSPKGYQIWADAIVPEVKKML